MPLPGPAFNWFCVISSAADILSHAARIRVSQIARSQVVVSSTTTRKRKTEPVVKKEDVTVFNGEVLPYVKETD